MENTIVNTIIIAVDMGEYDMQSSIDELTALCEADELNVVCSIVQKRSSPDVALYIGEGRAEQARLYCQNLEAEMAVVDAELTGSQIRNLETVLNVRVIDRTMLILEIFAKRAVTAEGKLQTELAELKYRLPRLTGLRASLSRQGGGGGGGGGARRGAGESALEYDKRYIRERIDGLQKKLEAVEKQREQTRRQRKKGSVSVIALTGYTNVGKSSLLNTLCGAEVEEKDMLFATLDPTVRKLVLPSGISAVAVDTVGFISRLPHGLVSAFRSTLEEAKYADVILKVCDIADENSATQLEITSEVLKELGCEDIPTITVYNKCDKDNSLAFDSSAVLTSAKTGFGLDKLLAEIDKALSSRAKHVFLKVPYEKMSWVSSFICENGSMIWQDYKADSAYCEALVKTQELHVLSEFVIDKIPEDL